RRGGDDRPGARPVLDHHGFPLPTCRQQLGEDAGDHIGGPACREWYEEAHRRCRKRHLGDAGPGKAQTGGEQAKRKDEGSHWLSPHHAQRTVTRVLSRAAAMTSGTAASLPGAMMWTPATPGISASSAISSTQRRCPSAAGSAACSRRVTVASGMM